MESKEWLSKWQEYNSAEEDSVAFDNLVIVNGKVTALKPTLIQRIKSAIPIIFNKYHKIRRQCAYKYVVFWEYRLLHNYKYVRIDDNGWYCDIKTGEYIAVWDLYSEAKTFKFKLDYVIRYSWR